MTITTNLAAAQLLLAESGATPYDIAVTEYGIKFQARTADDLAPLIALLTDATERPAPHEGTVQRRTTGTYLDTKVVAVWIEYPAEAVA